MRKRGNVGRQAWKSAAAARCGMESHTILKPIWFTRAPATPNRGRKSFAAAKGKDILYACSILAVQASTGELKWHYQTVPDDTWDFDSVQQMMLADLTINGKQRKVIMQASKNGFFYVLDRVTGEFISAQPYAKVNWAKGVDPKTGRPIVNPEARYGTRACHDFSVGGRRAQLVAHVVQSGHRPGLYFRQHAAAAGLSRA